MNAIERWKARLAPMLATGALVLVAACGGGGSGDGGNGDNGGNGGPSPAVEFVAVGSSGRTASLRWTPVAGATGYTIERRTGAGAYAPVATLAADVENYVDDGLAQNTEYTYRLVPAGVSATVVERVATTSSDVPIVTLAGTAQGAATQAAIDAAGGSIATADGGARLVVPAAALTAGTAVSLQPISNTAPDGQGPGVRVQVAAVTAKPLTLTLGYAAALDANADGLGIALRRSDGSWLSLPIVAIDKAARTLSVNLPAALAAGADGGRAQSQSARAAAAGVSLEFDVVTYLNFRLAPRTATIKTGATQLLVPHARTLVVIGHTCTEDPDYGCIPLPLLDTREIPFENQKAGYTRRWFVFAEEGGTPALGTITPRAGIGAVYQAPAQVPTPNPVIVTFSSRHDRSGRTLTLTSSIRVEEPVWTGILSALVAAPGGGGDLAFRLSMQAVWTAVEGSNGTLYRANGTQSIAVIDIHCDGEVSLATVPLPPGALTIDRSVEPPRFALDVGSVWNTVLSATCPNGSGSIDMEVPSQVQFEGTVGGNGTKIEGQTSQGGIVWDYALTSEL
jgi:hypothetical protein